MMGFLLGRVNYEVICENADDILDKLIKTSAINGINVSGEKMNFSCIYRDRYAVDEILHKSGAKVNKRQYRSLVHSLKKYKKRIGLFLGAVFAVLCIHYLSGCVWEIMVEGNENIKDEEIVRLLDELGFGVGIRKKNANVKSLANRILIADDRISWVAVNFDGTLARVQLKEADRTKIIEKKQNVNLVACHDGMIVRVDALDGTAVVNTGDVVTKGQMLVSAFVEKRTGGNILKGAKGFAFANTKRSYAVVVPLTFNEKKYTGNKCESYSFSFLGKSFTVPPLFAEKYENCDFNTEQGNVNFFTAKLPVFYEKESRLEYKVYTRRRTYPAAIELARKIAREKLFFDSPDFKIASVDESAENDGERLIYVCNFDGIENIAKPLEFELS